jgi:hypothetical protein
MAARGGGRHGDGDADPRDPLIRICDLAGRPRGTGFLADGDGTLLTSHEAVDGLARLVLHASGGQVCLAEAEAVTALPETGLALVATEGLTVPPLPVAPHGPVHPEQRVRLRIPYRVDGSVLGTTTVTYTATDRFHLLGEVYELALDVDLARAAPQASGTPLVDAATGAVLGVVATALHAGHRAAGFAIPLTAPGAPGPLARVLARNAATVPAYGRHLNLAGALDLTGTSVGTAAGPGEWREPVGREGVADDLCAFLAADGPHAPLVLGLVGEPGTGRSTELAQLAARRARGPRPAPTLWLRGAELRPGDGGLKDAVERSLRTAARIVGAGRQPGGVPSSPWPAAGIADPSPDLVADLAHQAGRPLLVLLDAPEEMPPVLAHALADWTAGTASWLRAGRVRLVVACRPEFWEQAGALLPRDLLYAGSAGWRGCAGSGRSARPAGCGGCAGCAGSAGSAGCGGLGGVAWAEEGRCQEAWSRDGVSQDVQDPSRRRWPRRRPPRRPPLRDLPPCLRLGDLTDDEAARARARYGLRPGDLAEPDAAHPLAMRLLSEIKAALPEELDPDESEAGGSVPPSRAALFSAHLDLVCLRIAVRLAATSEPPPRGAEVRRLAARVAGQVHEAARRCLGPGQGELDREAFEELFPWRTGWASAVLAEGLLVPAGAGYRFAHEEAADWLQALHLDVPTALYALVHRWFAPAGAAPAEAPVRLPSRPAARAGQPPPVPPAPAVAPAAFPRSLPVPHHRAGPVVQALLLSPPAALVTHLNGLVAALSEPSPAATRCTPHPPPTFAAASAGAVVSPTPVPSGTVEPKSPPTPSADLDADTVPNPRTRRSARPDAVCHPPAAPPSPQPAPGAAAPAEAGQAGVEDRAADIEGGMGEGRVGDGSWTGGGGRPGGSDGRSGVGWDGAGMGDGGWGDGRGRRVPGQRLVGHHGSAPDGRWGLGAGARRADALWWAAHLLREVLLRVADAGTYREVLRALAGQIVVRSVECGGFRRLGPGGLGAFGPWFWRRVPLATADRLELLRMLLPADGPPSAGGQDERFLSVVAELLREEPGEAMPAVCGWFGDDRPLQGEPRLTVASAAQALLHTHRRLSVDDLTDALVAAGRPAADEVLTALAEDEPSALCRAVDRWAHDPRPARHVAAATYGPRTVPYVRSDADRELLRYAALAILARPDDGTLHGAALGLLVRDPATRARHLPAALRHFTDGDPALPPGAVAAALPTDPEPVLAAFRTRLRGGDDSSAEALRALAAVAAPALARRTAALVEDHLRHRPGQAAAVAAYLDLRLEQGPQVRPVLLPLAAALLRDHPPEVRAALVPVFAAPGSHLSRPLRQELLETVLETERHPDVLDALLTAAADGARQRHPLLTRDLVHQLALLFVRTPEGAARFDRRLVELSTAAPEFAVMVRAWLADGHIWDTLVGPSARRALAAATATAACVPAP